MKEMKIFRCEVDMYRNNGFNSRTISTWLYQRPTQGIYLVCAKDEKEARTFLQRAIGFGSITIPRRDPYIPKDAPSMEYGQMCKVTQRNRQGHVAYEYDFNIRHALMPATE